MEHDEDEDWEVPEEGELISCDMVICILNGMLIESIHDIDEHLEVNKKSDKDEITVTSNKKKPKTTSNPFNLVLLSNIRGKIISGDNRSLIDDTIVSIR